MIMHKSFKASDRSYTAIIKKDIHKMVVEAGFPPKKTDEIDIIIAEITSNINKYGKDGELLVMIHPDPQQMYLEVIAIDNGPGMHEPLRMMEDGVSTTGTLGQGLGAIKRLSDKFEVFSIRHWGTVLLARVYSKTTPGIRNSSRPEFRHIIVAKPGEEMCGDGCVIEHTATQVKVLLGDGLGHGPEAHKAVAAAGAVFRESRETSPTALIREMHQAVKRTRGLVGSIVVIDLLAKRGWISGIGNIAVKSFSASQSRNHICYNGIIGLNIPGTMKDQDLLTGDANQYIVLCSDGIRSQWDITKYPGLLKYDLSMLAAVIYKDFARKTDDMSVVVGKLN
jgi:anti-sigma regulatory factor (Ser/Thr protein kinase)